MDNVTRLKVGQIVNVSRNEHGHDDCCGLYTVVGILSDDNYALTRGDVRGYVRENPENAAWHSDVHMHGSRISPMYPDI